MPMELEMLKGIYSICFRATYASIQMTYFSVKAFPYFTKTMLNCMASELACLLSRTFRHLAHQETKRGLRTVEQPESSIRPKSDKLPRPNDRELVSSFPRCLLTVFRRRWDAKSGDVSLSQQDMLLQPN